MVSTGGIIVFLVLAFVYCLPTIAAFYGKLTHRHAIGAVNILLGWTIAGWIAALVWVLVADASKAEAANRHGRR